MIIINNTHCDHRILRKLKTAVSQDGPIFVTDRYTSWEITHDYAQRCIDCFDNRGQFWGMLQKEDQE
jgi:hypothetical protein